MSIFGVYPTHNESDSTILYVPDKELMKDRREPVDTSGQTSTTDFNQSFFWNRYISIVNMSMEKI